MFANAGHREHAGHGRVVRGTWDVLKSPFGDEDEAIDAPAGKIGPALLGGGS